MSHNITFYPLGNAETILLELSNDKKMLIDFADTYSGERDDKRIELKKALGSDNSFDVVMFSHAHEDHVKGAKDFFYFEHALKYQEATRKKIEELWVSSAFMLDVGICEDARVIRQEAKYRLKKGKGIKIFAEPDSLNQWLEENGLTTKEVQHLIIHAGTLLDNSMHDLGEDIQFFVHAPFSEDSEDVEDRNDYSIVMQIRILDPFRNTNLFITGDVPYWVLDKIIARSIKKKNSEYLKWDLYDIPHHCSHTGLAEERGDTITQTSEEIECLLSFYGEANGFMVASCRTFDDVGVDDPQPPHIEAKRAYIKHGGSDKQFLTTMEYKNKYNPKPIKLEINDRGIREVRDSVNILTSSPPRAG